MFSSTPAGGEGFSLDLDATIFPAMELNSKAPPEVIERFLLECMNQARCWAYHDGFHEESHGFGPTRSCAERRWAKKEGSMLAQEIAFG